MPDTTVETSFVVTMRSGSVGAGSVDRVHDNHTRDVLRALHLGCGDGHDIRQVVRHDEDSPFWREVAELTYDPLGDDMGHHEGHDVPFVRKEL